MAEKAEKTKGGAKNHTYTFVIKSEVAEGEGQGKVNPNDVPDPVTPPPDNPSPKKPKEKEVKEQQAQSESINWGARAYVAYEKLKDVANMVMAYQISTISLREGRNELQERAQATYGIVMRGISVAESIVAGAIVGGGAGAIIGSAVGMGSQLVSLMQQSNTMQMQRAIENQMIVMQRIRGAGGNRNV